MVRPSKYARRFTMETPYSVGGPAAGHVMMRTAVDPAGRTVRGALNNCASSKTPWGTYLSGEENWMGYFGGGDNLSARQRRWGMRKDGASSGTSSTSGSTPANTQRTEPFRLGGGGRPDATHHTPVKRTALGRAAHEGAWVAVTKDGRAVVYSGARRRWNISTSSSAATRSPPAEPVPTVNCWTTAPCMLRGSTPAHRPLVAAGAWAGSADGSQRVRRPGRGGDQGAPGLRRPAGHQMDRPSGSPSSRIRLGLLHADQQQRPRPAQPAGRGRCQSPRQQQHGPDHPMEGRG